MFPAARPRPAAHTGVSSGTAEKAPPSSAECAQHCDNRMRFFPPQATVRIEFGLFIGWTCCSFRCRWSYAPGQRLAKRKARKEKQVTFVHCQNFRRSFYAGTRNDAHNCPAHLAEDCRNRAAASEKNPVPFLLDRPRPVFFWARPKENGGWDLPGAGTSQIASPYSAQVLLPVIFTSTNWPMRDLSPLRRTRRLPSVREARGNAGSSLSPSTSTRTVSPT